MKTTKKDRKKGKEEALLDFELCLLAPAYSFITEQIPIIEKEKKTLSDESKIEKYTQAISLLNTITKQLAFVLQLHKTRIQRVGDLSNEAIDSIDTRHISSLSLALNLLVLFNHLKNKKINILTLHNSLFDVEEIVIDEVEYDYAYLDKNYNVAVDFYNYFIKKFNVNVRLAKKMEIEEPCKKAS